MLIVAESSYGTLAALFWWRTSNPVKQRLPAERFASAIQTGIRYAYNNALLRATLLRTVGFFLFASAYWALLPLIAHDRISGGSQLYGVLLGSIGAGALGGALGLEWLRSKLGPDRLVALGELGAALALVLFGAAREPITAIAASLIAGACWIVVLSSLNVSAQFSLPEWVRGRGLAVYVTVFFGAMTLGSACWGEIARVGGLAFAHFLAAGGALLAIPLTWRCSCRAVPPSISRRPCTGRPQS